MKLYLISRASVWRRRGACLSFHIRRRPDLVTGDWNSLRNARGIMATQCMQECGSKHFFGLINVPLYGADGACQIQHVNI